MRKVRSVLFALILSALLVMLGCGIQPNAGVSGAGSMGAFVSLETRLPGDGGGPIGTRGLFEDTNINSVSVTAYHDSVLVGSADLVKRQGYWGGVVQVSVLGSVQFNAVGMDAEMHPLYQGQTTATVTGNADSVTIAVSAILLSAPAELTIVSVTSTGISLSWAPVDGAYGYKLFRDTSLSGGFANQVFGGAAAFFTDSGLPGARTYYYKVKATNAIGQGGSLSGAVWDTTLSAGPFQGRNAIAQVAGPVVGTGSSNTGIMKQVAVGNLTPSDFQVPSTAYAYLVSGDFIYMALPVTNISGQAQEFIKLTGITFYDSADNVLTPTGYTLDYNYVKGSIARVFDTTCTATCLAAGETGYVLIIEGGISSALDHVRFSIESTSPNADPGPIVLAESYTYSSNMLTVSIRNSGTADAVIRGYNLPAYILLDSDGTPLTWDFFIADFNNQTGDFFLPAGNTAMGSSYDFFSGRAAGGIVFLMDFEASSGSAAAPALSGNKVSRGVTGSPELRAEQIATAWTLRVERQEMDLLGKDAR